MKPNICVYCGEQKTLYQNNLCLKCLRPNMQRGSATIDHIRPFVKTITEIKNFPDGVA